MNDLLNINCCRLVLTFNLNCRQCPSELREAVASIIFASPRCSDLPDLLQVKNLFTAKYGKEFISAVCELQPDTNVNRTIIEKLSVSPPSAQTKLKLLKEIAKEHNVSWNPSETELEFSKKHDDLLELLDIIARKKREIQSEDKNRHKGILKASENEDPSI
ncbi:IST1-like protein [Bienertia sinuspersici]